MSDTPLALHIGENACDNRPRRITTDVRGLFRALAEPRGSSKDGHYVQLVEYADGAHRDLEHVTTVHGYVADLDSGDWDSDDIRDAMDGIACYVYSTFSSTPDSRRWRIVVPFDRPVDRSVFEAIHEHYFVPKFEPDLDAKSGNAAQLWYSRRRPREGSHDEAFEIEGELFDTSGFLDLAKAPPKARATANGEKPDHPVFRALNAAGLVLRRGGKPGMWLITCPWEQEHTTGEDGDGSTAYFEPHHGGFEGEGFRCQHAHCDQRRIADVRQRLGIARDHQAQPAGGGEASGDEQRPEVRIVAGEAIALCRELATRLAHARAPLYRRGPLLMRATRITNAEQDGIQRARDALILQRVSPAILMGDVSACVNLTKCNERAKAHVPADLPDRIARAFIEHAPELTALPAVAGITESPILLPDGALVTTPGHDAATGLIFDAGAIDWRTLRVPDHPTADDVRGAVEMLGNPLRDFPFVSDIDRAVALSAIITAVLRPQLPAAPLHGINATAPGTGKTLLANVVGMIATGRPVPAMAMGESAEEFAKRIDSALLAADPVALIDNVSRPIAGDTACINLTSSRVRVRILGRSEQVEIPAKTFWMATGNNLTFRGDMTRRVLLCTLDAGVERPDLREFARDLLAWVPIHRLRLLSAVFTLLRGYICAGSPKHGLAPLGGFEAWTRRVRDVLVWAGLPDVLGSTESIRNDDPELQQRVAIYQAWHATNGAEWRQVRDIKHAVRRTEDHTATCVAHELTFAEELASIGPGARFDAGALGRWLRSNRGRIAGGLRLEAKLDRKTKVQAWRVAPVGGA